MFGTICLKANLTILGYYGGSHWSMVTRGGGGFTKAIREVKFLGGTKWLLSRYLNSKKLTNSFVDYKVNIFLEIK